jgi:hypothetical protein
MKIRIHGNSIRIRLSKTEVERLSSEGQLKEQTSFGQSAFEYTLEQNFIAKELSASLEDRKITMQVPSGFLKDWAKNQVIGFDSKMPIGENETLYLLLEKDFKCLDNTNEDQSDNYENPKSC